MNRFPIALVVLFVASACGDVPTAVNEPGAPDPIFESRSKWILFQVKKFEFSNSQFWPCVNEWVDFAGRFDVTVRQVVSASGNTTFRFHVSGPPVKGVGRSSGDQYVSPEITNFTEHSSGSGSVTTFQIRIRRISKGGAPNSMGWIKFHLTYNAAGELTAFKNEAVFDVCRG